MTLQLPDGTHLIHLGAPKTGSTSLQRTLDARRDELAAFGVAFPSGNHFRAREAGWWVLGMDSPKGRRASTRADWDEYVAEVAACDQPRVLVSNEDFARSSPQAARRIVTDLGGDRPHIVFAVRGLDRILPSSYQESVKWGLTRTYLEYLQRYLADYDPANPPGPFPHHNVRTVVSRWLETVDPEQFTVIVSDEADRTVIPTAFSQLLGLPDDFLVGQEANQSLGWDVGEVVREFNVLWERESGDAAGHHHLGRRGFIAAATRLSTGPDTPRLPALPSWAHEKVAAMSAQQVEDLAWARDLGVRVIGGDPDRLLDMRPPQDDPQPPTHVSVQDAAAMLFGMYERSLKLSDAQRARLDKVRQRNAALRARQAHQAGKPGQPGQQKVADTSARDLAHELARRVGARVRGRLRELQSR